MIKTENLIKKFNDCTALNDISCTINSGCVYGLVGPNGAGKSTFVRVLTGVYKADSGSCTYDGQPVYENPEVKKHIVYVPDELYFLPSATLDRMAKMYASYYKRFDKDRYNELVNAFGLNPKKNLNQFSKGMRRQAATILALATKPEYIFFDETFDGLDPIMRNYVKKVILNDVAERSATAIITSHSLRELEDTCSQLAVLHKGGIVFESDIKNLKTEHYKIQIAFSEEFDQSKFEGIDIVNFSKNGLVANMIIKGDKEKTIETLKAMNPLLLDVLPLSLDEVFTYEMEALGYSYNIDGLTTERQG